MYLLAALITKGLDCSINVLMATARKLLFVHGVRFAALLGLGGGSND